MLSRIYVVQGVSKKGSRGQPSARAVVPLLTAPGPARPGTTAFDAGTVTITWQPPATRTDEAPGVTYNIYAVPGRWLWRGPSARHRSGAAQRRAHRGDDVLEAGAAAGAEQCFIVRSVATIGTVTIESDPQPGSCA